MRLKHTIVIEYDDKSPDIQQMIELQKLDELVKICEESFKEEMISQFSYTTIKDLKVEVKTEVIE